jgi:hypothetical protein
VSGSARHPSNGDYRIHVKQQLKKPYSLVDE